MLEKLAINLLTSVCTRFIEGPAVPDDIPIRGNSNFMLDTGFSTRRPRPSENNPIDSIVEEVAVAWWRENNLSFDISAGCIW